jgi:hypothetical protein
VVSQADGLFSDTQYSPVVIEQMIARNHSRPEMQCNLLLSSPRINKKTSKSERMAASGLVMDIRNLTFEDGTFDTVIDKGKHFPVRA